MEKIEFYRVTLPEVIQGAILVLNNEYGVDPERRERLKADGYDPDKVQACVNDLLKLGEKYG